MKGAITTTQALAAVKRYGSQRAAAKALGFKSHKPISSALKRAQPAESTPTSAPTKRVRRSKGLSRAQFAATFDNDTRIRTFVVAAVKSLTNEDEILEDSQFRVERCQKASLTGWRTITAEPEFAQYRFEVKNKIFWTTPTTRKWALENVEGAK
jgi:hypothetical protein